MERVIFNVKPSSRIQNRFKNEFSDARFIGSASLGSKIKSYSIPVEIYEANKEKLKTFGSKARHQY